MANININLNLNDSLEYDGNNKLCVKKSHKSGNTLTIESDGLYAQAIPGNPGSTGTGFPDGYRATQTGLKSGEAFPDSTDPVPRRLVAPKIIHRIYTSNTANGSELTDKRSVDILYPGDMFRVHNTEDEAWEYYVITQTDGNNVIGVSEMVASISDEYDNVN
jgi:hypothetical protein